jgi:cytoskeleton protein RodZ
MDSEEPQQPAVGKPAGQLLKRAREKLGLSVKDVAGAQHLRVFIIEAIEDGNYNQIDSELFLKGYVRAYAKQVGADADALIESLDLELEPLRRERAEQEQENPLLDIERRRRKKRKVAKTLFIIVVLGAVALAAWKLVLEPRMAVELPVGQEQSEPGEAAAGSETAESDGAESSVIESSGADQNSESKESVEPGVNAEVDSNAGLEDSPELLESLRPLEKLELTEDPIIAEVSSETQAPGNDVGNNGDSNPLSNELVAVEPVVQPNPVFEESAQPQSVSPPTRLEMSFVSDCWVQVTDSSGARLVASLQRDGDQISVSGRAPFNVVIGAVDAVGAVSYGGGPVDLSSFRVVNNRTEFTLTL